MNLMQKFNFLLIMLMSMQVFNMHAMKKLKESDSDTPLIRAIKNNNDAMVARLINDYRTQLWRNPNPMVNSSRQLISYVNESDKERDYSPLMYAAMINNRQAAELLILFGARITFRSDKDGAFPLKIAVEFDSDEVLKILIKNGDDINQQFINYWNSLNFPVYTSLMHVAVSNKSYKVAKILIDARVNCNILGGVVKQTPLFDAIEKKDPQMIQYLIAGGADLNITNGYGLTPLINSVRYGCYECVKLLIDAGADVNWKDSDGETAFDYAQTQSADIIDLLTPQEDKEYSWEAALS